MYLWHLCLSLRPLRLNFYRKQEWLSDRKAGIQFNLQPMDSSCFGVPSTVWSVAAKKHSKKTAVLKGIKKGENTGKFVTKLVEELTFTFFKFETVRFTCTAELENLPRPRYFVRIYVTKRRKHWLELLVLCRISIIN